MCRMMSQKATAKVTNAHLSQPNLIVVSIVGSLTISMCKVNGIKALVTAETLVRGNCWIRQVPVICSTE
jgi:hypothetical protein